MSEADPARKLSAAADDGSDRTPSRPDGKAAADDYELSADDPRAKSDPEVLKVRTQAARVVRIRRGLLLGVAGGVLVVFVGLSWFALEPAGLKLAAAEQEPVPSLTGKSPEELDRLPSGYGDEAMQPKLGPPLPGDLGRPILERQREMATEANVTPAPAVAPDVRAQAAVTERERRLAELVQARNAPVLMQVSRGANGASQAQLATAGDPSAVSAAPLRTVADDGINPHRLRPAASRWQISAGSVISASLITGLNSDLPGLVVAQVTEPVFDSATGRAVLIPQGARLLGRYDSKVAFGQRRALLVWERLVMPDASSIALDNAPATDAAGYSGLSDGVDFHTWQLLRGVGFSTLLGVGTELTFGEGEADLVRALRESVQSNADRAGQKIVERNLDIAPTITVRPGVPVRVLVHKDLILPPWRS